MSHTISDDSVRDVTAISRKLRRAAKTTCPHSWREQTKRIRSKAHLIEVCTKCDETFPCRDVDCDHFDCAELQIDMGLRKRFPNHSTLLYSSANGRVLFDNH